MIHEDEITKKKISKTIRELVLYAVFLITSCVGKFLKQTFN